MVCTFCLCSCGLFQKEEPVGIKRYSADQIVNGFFIKDDEVFTGLFYSYDRNFSGKSEKSSVTRQIWLKGNEGLVPIVGKNSTLVFSSDTTPYPTSFTLEYFKDLGITLGITSITYSSEDDERIVIDENAEDEAIDEIPENEEETEEETEEEKEAAEEMDEPEEYQNIYGGYVIKFADCLYQHSNLYDVIGGKNAKDTLGELYSINGSRLTAKNFNEAGAFAGLEEGKSYTIGLYIGTKYHEVTAVTDSRLLCSNEVYTIERASITKDGYITVRLPKDLEEGYYVVEGEGMFYYDPEYEGEE